MTKIQCNLLFGGTNLFLFVTPIPHPNTGSRITSGSYDWLASAAVLTDKVSRPGGGASKHDHTTIV